VWTPSAARWANAILFVGWQAQQDCDLVDALYRDERILVKFQPKFAGIRVSLASFNTAEEVDRLLGAPQCRVGR
jgi:selenocysteine lyase/cysteine desulfurase